MALVDYAGSDSDDSDMEEETPQKTQSVAPQKKTLGDEDAFFDNDVEKDGSLSGLNLNNEDVLEEIVKPKDWERKLAEKAKKKLEKKAAKKALKLEKKLAKKAKKSEKIAKIAGGVQKKEKSKVVISAFGALAGIGGGNSSDDSDGEEKEVVAVKPKGGSGFLSSLPAPKGKDNKSGGIAAQSKSLVPPSVAKKATPFVPAKLAAPAPKIMDDSDDDDDGSTDFFGFHSAPAKREDTSAAVDVPFMAMNSSMDVVGPSRPTEDDEVDPTLMYRNPEEESREGTSSAANQWLHRTISDEQAHKLLMKFSHDIGPEERRSINEMASSIVDVNVDSALGPDVKTNILKNLSHRQFVESTSAPLPQVQTAGQTSRRKHQITYLANMAVAREEQLKDQWAQQKQTKRMARQKYGF